MPGCSWLSIRLFITSVGAVVGYYVGGFDGFLRVLLAFMVLDYITAFALAAKERRLSSDIGFWGIFKKILIFAVVSLANLIDNEIVYTGDMLRTAVVFFYVANEGLSVLENCAALGLFIPEGVRVALLKIRNNKHEGDSFPVHKKSTEFESYGMTRAMYDELTYGRGADELHE